MPARYIDWSQLEVDNTKIKKVGIHFDDGTYSDGGNTIGNGNGDGDGKGVATRSKLRYKHGEILDIGHGFVYFLEDNGRFSMIPVCRIFRIEGEKL